eukprot:NODE_1010_length_2184_cov_33.343037_g863_i0.p1 GENE.NODE_1010_length_2184_cov_33.343037_g863_i0~~NODE_1010_length_2184_cov_33.343037_g863_i0.p1  ORF type:complete len:667 (-),score=158.94 NODE_1010_length_2184_cov_33.343037_g863_i0:182-2182(-)
MGLNEISPTLTLAMTKSATIYFNSETAVYLFVPMIPSIIQLETFRSTIALALSISTIRVQVNIIEIDQSSSSSKFHSQQAAYNSIINVKFMDGLPQQLLPKSTSLSNSLIIKCLDITDPFSISTSCLYACAAPCTYRPRTPLLSNTLYDPRSGLVPGQNAVITLEIPINVNQPDLTLKSYYWISIVKGNQCVGAKPEAGAIIGDPYYQPNAKGGLNVTFAFQVPDKNFTVCYDPIGNSTYPLSSKSIALGKIPVRTSTVTAPHSQSKDVEDWMAWILLFFFLVLLMCIICVTCLACRSKICPKREKQYIAPEPKEVSIEEPPMIEEPKEIPEELPEGDKQEEEVPEVTVDNGPEERNEFDDQSDLKNEEPTEQYVNMMAPPEPTDEIIDDTKEENDPKNNKLMIKAPETFNWPPPFHEEHFPPPTPDKNNDQKKLIVATQDPTEQPHYEDLNLNIKWAPPEPESQSEPMPLPIPPHPQYATWWPDSLDKSSQPYYVPYAVAVGEPIRPVTAQPISRNQLAIPMLEGGFLEMPSLPGQSLSRPSSPRNSSPTKPHRETPLMDYFNKWLKEKPPPLPPPPNERDWGVPNDHHYRKELQTEQATLNHLKQELEHELHEIDTSIDSIQNRVIHTPQQERDRRPNTFNNSPSPIRRSPNLRRTPYLASPKR